MKYILYLLCILYVSLFPVAHCANADSLMSFYRAALQHFPSVESFKNKEQSLQYENKALGWQRLLNMDMTLNYFRLSTTELGKYSNGDLTILNTFDLFNKKGLDRSINRFEIQKNKSLSDAEKKNLFTTITEAYFNLLKNKQLLKMHQESLDWIEKNILLVNKGVEKGLFPSSEISRWTIEKLSRQNSIQSDKLEIAWSEESMKVLTGIDSITPEDYAEADYEELKEEDLLKHSPELIVFDMEKQQVETEISKEYRDKYPDLQVGNSLVMNHEPESTGDQYVVSANLSFKLFDGGRKYRILSDRARIKSIENDQKAALSLLAEFYRNRLREMNTQKDMLKNLQEARDLSTDNLNKLLIGYQKRFVDFTTLFTAFRDDVLLREDYVNIFFGFNQSYQYLYHLSRGDIYQ
jgi:outer membrane protein